MRFVNKTRRRNSSSGRAGDTHHARERWNTDIHTSVHTVHLQQILS